MDSKFIVELTVRIRQTSEYFSNDTLNLTETVEMKAGDFMELCQILVQFHLLAEKMRKPS